MLDCAFSALSGNTLYAKVVQFDSITRITQNKQKIAVTCLNYVFKTDACANSTEPMPSRLAFSALLRLLEIQ